MLLVQPLPSDNRLHHYLMPANSMMVGAIFRSNQNDIQFETNLA